jgi:hypothetical protein
VFPVVVGGHLNIAFAGALSRGGFLILAGLMNVTPMLGYFFAFALVRDIAFEVTAISADVVVQGCDGNQTDGNGIASEGTAFQGDFISTIHRIGSAFRAFAVFHKGLLSVCIQKVIRMSGCMKRVRNAAQPNMA